MPKKLTNLERHELAKQRITDAYRIITELPASIQNVRVLLRELQYATAVLRSLECSMNGIPEPKEGE